MDAALTVSDHALPVPSGSARRTPSLTRLAEHASLLLPFVAVGVGAWLSLRSDERSRRAGVTTLGTAVGLGVARWQLGRFFSEQAHYQVEHSNGNFEVRLYEPRVQAETVISAAPWRDSLEHGFHRLAGYIFGKNATHAKIAMTAPVTITVGASDRAIRSIAFKMPDDFELGSLPEPEDRSIALRRIPSRRIAALRFSGRYGAQLPDGKRRELLSYVRGAGLMPIGEVMFAGYDAPTTLPWLRRNEVLVEVSTLRPAQAP